MMKRVCCPFPVLTFGDAAYTLPAVNLVAQGSGQLYAWIDFNGNGSFEDAEFATVAVTNGVLAGDLSFSGFGTVTVSGSTFVRLRLTADTLTAADAATVAANGEVEDYQLAISSINNLPNNLPELTTNNGEPINVAINEYRLVGNEGIPPVLVDIDATDLEDGAETNLSYTLSGDDAVYFGISSLINSFGEIEFVIEPDYENPRDANGDNVYEIMVTVTDSQCYRYQLFWSRSIMSMKTVIMTACWIRWKPCWGLTRKTWIRMVTGCATAWKTSTPMAWWMPEKPIPWMPIRMMTA
ncbi:MAG: cadherin repeat domain-containing protein [Thiolinea sp.]